MRTVEAVEECQVVTVEHEGGSGVERGRERERERDFRPDPERTESPESGSDTGQRQSGLGALSETIINVRRHEQRPISVHVSQEESSRGSSTEVSLVMKVLGGARYY